MDVPRLRTPPPLVPVSPLDVAALEPLLRAGVDPTAKPVFLAVLGRDAHALRSALTRADARAALRLHAWSLCGPLQLAASLGQDALVEQLLVAGALVNAVDARGRTALLEAAVGGFEAVLHTLLRRGANPLARDTSSMTAAYAAAAQGHTELLQTLLVQAPALADVVTDAGDTPLHAAAAAGHLGSSTLLAERATAMVSTRNRAGFTPLRVALHAGHALVVACLLRHGASDGPRGLELALPHPRCIQVLLENSYDPSACNALFLAVACGYADSTAYLLAQKYAHLDVNARAERFGGNTVAHAAAWRGDAALLRQLRAYDGRLDVNQENTAGATPLLLAASLGHVDAVRCLLQDFAATDVDVQSQDGATALYMAAWRGYVDVLALLLEEGQGIGSHAAKGHPHDSQQHQRTLSSSLRRETLHFTRRCITATRGARSCCSKQG